MTDGHHRTGRVTTTIDRNVAFVTIDREPLNVLDVSMLGALATALQTLSTNDHICAIVLRGGGDRAFSAGVELADHTPERTRAMFAAVDGVLWWIDNLPVPVVAAVRGFCLGGALELALACQLVVAESDASFGLPEISVGCFPPVACARLADIVGHARAADMILTGEPISAATALAAGLVSRIGPLDRTLEEMLGALRQKSRAVLRAALAALRVGRVSSAPGLGGVGALLAGAAMLGGHGWVLPVGGGGSRWQDGKDKYVALAEQAYLDTLLQLPDLAEGLAAFLEKRAPRWQHR